MATYTSFLNLEKPTTSERLDVLKINSNWDKIDAGVSALNSQLEFQRNDTFTTNGAQCVFRTLADKSAILFSIRLPKDCASNVNSFNVEITANSTTWFTGASLGNVQSGATAGNISLKGKKVIQFSVPVPNTIQETGFGICELNATITFTA